MSNVVGVKICNPNTGESVGVGSEQELANHATKFVKEFWDSRKFDKTRTNDNRYVLCVIHVREPERVGHRWFDLAPRQVNYHQESLAQSIFNGDWRLATPEEEKACAKKDQEASELARVAAVKKDAQKKVDEMRVTKELLKDEAPSEIELLKEQLKKLQDEVKKAKKE